jgi:hypothetical protein
MKAVSGLNKVGCVGPKTGAYSFCTDGSAVIKYREIFPKDAVEIIGFGPASEHGAHTINESIDLEEAKKAFYGYIGIVSELLKKG